MALKVSKLLNNGVTGEYLRIKEVLNRPLINVSGWVGETSIVVEYWLDDELRERAKEGETCGFLQEVRNFGTDQLFSTISEAYTYLKTLGTLISDGIIEDIIDQDGDEDDDA